MTAKYHLLAHPELANQLRALRVRAQADPSSPEAQQFAAVRTGLNILREGREAESDGERLGYSDRHPDLRDCAEIKLPVVEEFNRRRRPMGPSHRLTYREFDGSTAQHLPVRQVIAFEPRKDGRPFTVTAARLGRTKGVPLAELDELPNVTPAVGPSKEAGRPTGPARRPLPPDLEQAVKALDGQPSASGAVRTPSDHQRSTNRRGTPGKPTRER